MNGKNLAVIASGALVLGILAPGVADSQTVTATADVNLRAGPGTGFPVVTTIPSTRNVTVYGCDQQRNWCDVEFRGNRGWVFADFLEVEHQQRRGAIAEIGVRLGLPTVTFEAGPYWDRHYADRPWYDDRDRWTLGGSATAAQGDRGWGQDAPAAIERRQDWGSQPQTTGSFDARQSPTAAQGDRGWGQEAEDDRRRQQWGTQPPVGTGAFQGGPSPSAAEGNRGWGQDVR
jgi:uncharacterized protein YraI